MIAVLIPLTMVSSAIAVVVSGYILHNSDTQIQSKKALDIVDNARLLQRVSSFDSSQNKSYLMDSYKMPLSSLIVRDGNITDVEINAFSKQYEAIKVLLEDNPNFSNVGDCVLMASTAKISEAECELVKDKQFKVYTLDKGAVSFDIDNNTSLLKHIKSIESNYANIKSDEITIVEKEGETLLSLGSSEQSVRSLRREFLKEEEIIKDLDSLLGKGDFVGAAALGNKLAVTSANFELVKSQLNKVAVAALAAPVVSEDEISRVKIAKAYIADAAVNVVERSGVDATAAVAFMQEQESLSSVLSSEAVVSENNGFIGAVLEEKVVSFFR